MGSIVSKRQPKATNESTIHPTSQQNTRAPTAGDSISNESAVVTKKTPSSPLMPRLSICRTFKLQPNAGVFDKLREMFRSATFMVYAANQLYRCHCVLDGIPYGEAINEHEKERIACSWASIPAADAAAHQIAFHIKRHKDNTNELLLRDPGQFEGFEISERDYMEALLLLSSSTSLPRDYLFLSVNCAHLAYRSGLPFREMSTSLYGPMRTSAGNKPFSHISNLDREKSLTAIRRAAQLMVQYLQLLDKEQKENKKFSNFDVFLGGSCNPTTWRADIAVPMLNAAGVSFYNPQVDDWTPDLVEIEARAKARAKILIFIVDSQTRALASMLEASEYISSGRTVLLAVNIVQPGASFGGVGVSVEEIKDLNRGRMYLLELAKRNNVHVYEDIPSVIRQCIKMCKDTPVMQV